MTMKVLHAKCAQIVEKGSKRSRGGKKTEQQSQGSSRAAPRRIEKQQQHFVVAVQKIVKTIAS